MKKQQYLWIVSLVIFHLHQNAMAQCNLVSNGDFEQKVDCSGNYQATSWYVAGGTPDYFNTCNAHNWVPSNSFGNQSPHSGTGYSGEYMYNYPEYLQTQLTSPLVAGQRYNIKMFVSLGEYSAPTSGNIGFYLSTTAVTEVNSYIIAQPQVYRTAIVSDYTNWTEISGTFIASGGEQYLTIGNFFSAANTPHGTNTYPGANLVGAYYYFDDVSLTPASPVISTSTGSTTLCLGQSLTLSASGGANYYWNTGSASASITVAPSTTTTYAVQSSVNGCAPVSSSVTVNVITCNGSNTRLVFDGVDDQATVPERVYNFAGAFTLESWVFLKSNSMRPILSRRYFSADGSRTYGFYLLTYGSGGLIMQFNGVNIVSNSFPPIDGSCHHIAVTRSSTGTVNFYVDGQAAGSGNYSGDVSALTQLHIGYDANGDGSFDGSINEVRIWNVERTASEILNNLSSTFSSATPNLIGYFRFKEATGNTILDNSSNKLFGYLGTNKNGADPQDPARDGFYCFTSDRMGNNDPAALPDVTSGLNVNIYPNPSKRDATFVIKGNENEKITVSVLDAQGRVADEMIVNTNEPVSFGGNLPPGVYIIKFVENNRSSAYRFIKTE